jgi:predicted DNA-binding transcriptional regulator YafY
LEIFVLPGGTSETRSVEVDNKFIAYFPFIEDDFSYGMILRLGDKCECLEPENVRLEVIRRVENLLSIYKKE